MKRLSLIFSLLIGFNIVVWGSIAVKASPTELNVYFLDVGQGDSSLIVLPGGVKVLIDGGPANKSVLGELDKVLPAADRYIDLVMLTHPQLDHFGGLTDVLKRYRVGAFIHNGRDGDTEAWEYFKKVFKEQGIMTILLKEGDKISFASSKIDILSPNAEFMKSQELNDTGLVAEVFSEGAKILFSADIGFKVEEYLTRKYDMDVDVLKVGHHGSRFSSGSSFLSEVTPLMASISSGKNNYGHPTPAAMKRLSDSGSEVYSTDQEGTIHLNAMNGEIRAYSLK